MNQLTHEEQLLQKLILMKNNTVNLRAATLEQKNNVLKELKTLIANHKKELLNYNNQDIEEYKNSDKFQKYFLDRLVLNEKRIESILKSLDDIILLPNPIGIKTEERTLKNGIVLQKVRSPLGVLFLIFESRPNVITEAFALALKSGNAIILKGGKETDLTAHFLYQLIEQALEKNSFSKDTFWGLHHAKRETTDFLLKQNKLIDVLIPRGGEKLIEFVENNSTIPLIKNEKGLCHLYVHKDADLSMALNILDNAKTQRPSVCNAVETLLVDESIAKQFLSEAFKLLNSKGVEWFGCPTTIKLLNDPEGVTLATIKNFHTEYLDLKLNVKVVKDLQAALKHIEVHGSKHSEAIITRDAKIADEFMAKVDAAVSYWNASTRFTDGYEFGLGGEIGISTQKLHVRGPLGLDALTSMRWIAKGTGQIRD